MTATTCEPTIFGNYIDPLDGLLRAVRVNHACSDSPQPPRPRDADIFGGFHGWLLIRTQAREQLLPRSRIVPRLGFVGFRVVSSERR